METGQIKKFAIEARQKLKQGVAAKIQTLGFDQNGNVAEDMKPLQVQNGCVWKGETNTLDFYRQWMSLYDRVQTKGVQEVYEEAAYTWFNRLVAIRILQKNNLIDPVLAYSDELSHTPQIVDDARMGRMPSMDIHTKERLEKLLDDDRLVAQQFALLITAYCHDNPIIQSAFGSIADYTELLLPDNILTEGGFIDMLNHTDFIKDEDYASPELIGWLYQFYISEKKDEVFAKKGKYDADEIPAATQIFTPNWIVKYMVENTIGRIYLDNHPEAGQFRAKWLYLVDNEEHREEHLTVNELTDLKCADLACGSGHILNEMFDLLYDLYLFEGYTRREAVENIFSHNLTGIDLDTRAKQLATFALLLKACQKDKSFADAHVLPNVMDMPVPISEDQIPAAIHAFFAGEETKNMTKEITAAYQLMQNADSLGSIMKFDISSETRYAITSTLDYWASQQFVAEEVTKQIPLMRLILTLKEQYDALVMNPPYMGGARMGDALKNYVNRNYPETKADLFSVFMDVAIDRLKQNGKYGMINMQSWMFLSSFENLRTRLLEEQQIDSMLHLGPRTFDELSGEVVQNTAYVITKNKPQDNGVYYRLVDGKDCGDKERMFLKKQNVYNVSQSNFEKIPGCPIGYWVSEKIVETFTRNRALSAVCKPTQGLATADNARFLRSWFEVSQSRIGFGFDNAASAARSQKKWFPYRKGGAFRRWFGNVYLVVNWENDGNDIKCYNGAVVRNPTFYFRDGITWSLTSSTGCAFRYAGQGALFDVNGMSLFTQDHNDLFIILAGLNTKVTTLCANLINPTLALQCGDVAKLPFLDADKTAKGEIKGLVQQNINISKSDWDAHETSWDFQTNELIRIANETGPIEASIDGNVIQRYFSLMLLNDQYKAIWNGKFKQLHDNEEELNRQFIDIYGLQDELKPDVPLSEITILQQGEISIEGNQIKWHDDVIMKQLISYAAGCFMGRYRLDKPGLAIAHPNPTAEELAPYEYNGKEFEIDDDGIFPLMPKDCGFSDNACLRLADFVGQVFGDDSQAENLNYIEQCLGKSIEQYFIKDFWKDHKKMYQNHPIYWLFSSKKGAFQCVAYMHRMNPWTAERVRAKYLLPFIERLQQKEQELQSRAEELSTAETRRLETLRKQIAECQEYHERLQVMAEKQIDFDLDDGVVVNYAKFGDVLAKIK